MFCQKRIVFICPSWKILLGLPHATAHRPQGFCMKVVSLFLPAIREMLEQKSFQDLRRILAYVDPIDLADGWSSLKLEEQAILFRLLTRRHATVLFEELESSEQTALLNHLKDVDIQTLVANLDPGETSKLFRKLPEKMTRHLASLMKHDSLSTVEQLMQFPPETVGGRMHTGIFLVQPDWTVKQVIDKLRTTVRLRHLDDSFFENLYVVDSQGHFLGQVPLNELVVAPGELKIAELVHHAAITLNPKMDQEEAGKLLSHYKLANAPVVDENEKILGIMRVGEVYDIIKQETEEDFAKMAGMAKSNYWSREVFGAVGLRFPWLVATCIGELAVSWMIRAFEPTLQKIVALVTFMPFIAAMGGNVGSQSATIMVRGLATGEVSHKDRNRAVLKEAKVGFLVGLLYGTVVGTIAYMIYGANFGPLFPVVVGLGLVISMTVAATIGSLEPFVLLRLGMDPATSTGPMITTITDLFSTFSYFGLATWMLLRFHI